ncbi:MAG: alpha/beta-hydrolase family protein [Microthrixaceae bacterium]
MVDAYGPSLMPRATMHQGMAAGLAVLAAAAVNAPVHWVSSRIAPPETPIGWRLLARGGIAAAGWSLANLSETDDEHTLVSSVRSIGDLTVAAALGGMVYEAAEESRRRFPAKGPWRPLAIGGAGAGYALYRSARSLKARSALIQRWSDDDKPANLLGTVGIGVAVSTVGHLLGKAFRASARGTADFFGPDIPHQVIGRAVNAAAWGAGAAALYNTGVARIARSNEKVEPGYDEPPTSEHVSGGPASISPFGELGLQGRRYVTDVVTPELIEQTLGEPAVAHPVRAYVGVNSEPVYPAGRAEMICNEMERLGAFRALAPSAVLPDRHRMGRPGGGVGRGAVHTWRHGHRVRAVRTFAVLPRRADRGPGQVAVPPAHVERAPAPGGAAARAPAEGLRLWREPRRVGFVGHRDAHRHRGPRPLRRGPRSGSAYPGSPSGPVPGCRRAGSQRARGTVGAFDRPEQFAALSQEQRDAMRAVILDHDNDPIALMSPRLAVKRPPWLEGESGRNVPGQMTWTPVLTLVQVVVDAMNAMRTIPGEFKSFGHDYRGDTAAFVHGAFGLPAVSAEQFAAVEKALVNLEVERGKRLEAAKAAGVGDATTEVQ